MSKFSRRPTTDHSHQRDAQCKVPTNDWTQLLDLHQHNVTSALLVREEPPSMSIMLPWLETARSQVHDQWGISLGRHVCFFCCFLVLILSEGSTLRNLHHSTNLASETISNNALALVLASWLAQTRSQQLSLCRRFRFLCSGEPHTAASFSRDYPACDFLHPCRHCWRQCRHRHRYIAKIRSRQAK